MPNDELLTAIRLEIREALRIDREETIKRTLERFGLDMSKNDDWISQHQADRLIGKAQRIKGKEKISKNCYRGEVITDPSDIIRLAKEKKAIYASNMWRIRPAAVIMQMQFSQVMRLIEERTLYFIIKDAEK